MGSALTDALGGATQVPTWAPPLEILPRTDGALRDSHARSAFAAGALCAAVAIA